jgi:hypothetical protein
MSAISAAIKRRAGNTNVKPNVSEPSFSTLNRSSNQYDSNPYDNIGHDGKSGAPMFTLQQAILLIDKRITALESQPRSEVKAGGITEDMNKELESISNSFSEITAEFDSRYNMLANELVDLKNIVMSLQSYTMDVNKMLLEERVRILSEITEPGPTDTEESGEHVVHE